MNYYNEYDPKAAEWLRQLIALGAIPDGDIDERSITDVQPSDLLGYTQCHFFAGIAGWSRALQLAGVPPTRPLWTGSCPCQAFSVAGKQKGFDDHRDLWPEFFRLIRQCKPQRILGEQVEGAVRFGWLDRLHSDMEAEGYTCGAVVLGAHSAGADHIRQRIFWVADAARGKDRPRESGSVGKAAQGRSRPFHAPLHAGQHGAVARPDSDRLGEGRHRIPPQERDGAFRDGALRRLPDPDDIRRQRQPHQQPPGILTPPHGEAGQQQIARPHNAGEHPDIGLADTPGGQRQQRGRPQGHDIQRPPHDSAGRELENPQRVGRRGRGDGDQAGCGRALQIAGSGGTGGRMAHPVGERGRGRQPRHGDASDAGESGQARRLPAPPREGRDRFTGQGDRECEPGRLETLAAGHPAHAGHAPHFWSDAIPHLCLDGKARHFEPRVFPLVDVLPRGVGHSGDPRQPEYANATSEARVMRLKGYGNAIVPETAAIFIRAVNDTLNENFQSDSTTPIHSTTSTTTNP